MNVPLLKRAANIDVLAIPANKTLKILKRFFSSQLYANLRQRVRPPGKHDLGHNTYWIGGKNTIFVLYQ